VNGLFGSSVLEIAIGLIFVYLLLSILCTTVNEWIAAVLKARSNNLREAIAGLLDGQEIEKSKQFLVAFYGHPLITSLMERGKSHPSYLPSRAFATAVMDLVTPTHQGVISFDDLESGIKNLPDGDVRSTLLALIQNTNRRLETAQLNIEGWFDDAMDRASGWYKRRTQKWTVALAVALTIAANADTIDISKRLWTDSVLRGGVVEYAKAHQGQITTNGLTSVGSLIGWANADSIPQDLRDWGLRLAGWLFTAIAVSLGSPFWFDVLNKFMNLRNAGKSPDEAAKAPEKKKLYPEDRSA
jgi:hypothetical protein